MEMLVVSFLKQHLAFYPRLYGRDPSQFLENRSFDFRPKRETC